MKQTFLSFFSAFLIAIGFGCGGGQPAAPGKPVKVIGFDENYATLRAIDAGQCQGTVCQQPFVFGYESVKYMRELVVGGKTVDQLGLPTNKLVFVDTIVVEKGEGSNYIAKCEGLKKSASAEPPPGEKKAKFAFVTNGSADFWKYCEAGIRQAEKDFGDIEVVWKVGDGTPEKQRRIVDDLINAGIQALAISPLDPKGQTTMINSWAEKIPVICCDSDAPNSNRAFYLGTDNVAAGRQVGELVKKALPEGGKIMVFVGIKEVANAQERFQGLKESIEGTNIEVIDLLTDNIDFAKARANAENTLSTYPDVAAMVGLWEYNPPQILKALESAKRLSSD